MANSLVSFFFLAIALICATGASGTGRERLPVNIVKGINGLDKIVLGEVNGSSVEVYLYGAQVTSWKNKCGEELLLLSSKAIFKPPTAIRGGIPIIFPQFSSLGPLPSHGFARNRIWSIDSNPPRFPTRSSAKVFVDLILKSTEADLKIWPNSFVYRLRIELSPTGDLKLTSRISNTNSDGKPFTFMSAYHTYFRVSDISKVRVVGLKNLDYLDNLQNRTRFTEHGNAVTFQAELDRIYLGTPKKIAILDEKRTFVLRKDGLLDAVVWNPWTKNISDLGVDDYKRMVAVEAAAIEKPINLKPGQEWTGSLHISAIPA